MPSPPPKVRSYYFDSSVHLALINEEKGRFGIIEALLEEAERQECRIFTSQLSIVEVAFGASEKLGKALSKPAETKIDKLWHPTSPIQLIDVHAALTFSAKDLIRDALKEGWTKGEEWTLKPADAIHLATAKQLDPKPDYIFTYDNKWPKLSNCIGIQIREPFLVQEVLGLSGTRGK